MEFKVRLIQSNQETVVYSIKDHGNDILFLVYLEEWQWIDATWFEPIQ